MSLLRRGLRPAGVRKDGRVIQIEGDPDSPISRGRLCPKGSASEQLREQPRARVPGQVPASPRHGVGGARPRDGHGHDRRPGGGRPGRDLGGAREGDPHARLARTRGLAFYGGATLDSEENYLIKKLFTALGAMQIENQARI